MSEALLERIIQNQDAQQGDIKDLAKAIQAGVVEQGKMRVEWARTNEQLIGVLKKTTSQDAEIRELRENDHVRKAEIEANTRKVNIGVCIVGVISSSTVALFVYFMKSLIDKMG